MNTGTVVTSTSTKSSSPAPRTAKARLPFCPACNSPTTNAHVVPYRLTGDEHRWDADHCFLDNPVLICGTCQLGFTGNEMSAAELDAFYKKVYAHYADLKYGPMPFPEFNARFLSQALYLKSFVDLFDGMRVLEIGSSEVGVLPTLSLFCKPRYFYFDQTDSPVIQSFGGERLGTFATSAAIAKTVKEGSLDLVYMSHSLEHLNPTELREMLQSILRSLKSGGVFFFEVPNEVAHDLSKAQLYPPHTLFFTEKSIGLLLRGCGLEVEVLTVHGMEHFKKYEVPNSFQVQVPGAQTGLSLGHRIKNALLRNPITYRLLRPLLWRRFLAASLRNLRTPYEHESYFRVVARKP